LGLEFTDMKTIIEMAREAGIRDCTCDGTRGCLERFAALVLVNTDPQSFMTWQEGNEAGRLSEREAILDLVDSYAKNNTDLADAIRARGQA
jgi:hypothetical protein